MKVALIKRKELNTKLWDDCIDTSPQSLLFAYSWYLDLVTQDWWGAVIEHDNQYVWVMPFPIDKKINFKFIRMPLFTPELGYFSTLPEPSFFLKDALKLIKEKVPYCIDYIGNSSGKYPDFQWGEDLSINLSNGYEHIISKFSKTKRKNVRQSMKRNNTPIMDQNIDGFLQLLRRFTLPKIGITNDQQISIMLEELLTVLIKKKRLRIYSIYGENQEIEASSIFVQHNSRWQYFLNTADTYEKNKHGRLLIFNQFLKEESEKPLFLHLGAYIQTPQSTETYEQEVRKHFEQLTQERVQIPYTYWNHLPWYINIPHQVKKFIFKNLINK
ncbi:hypothetical protein [Flammeovirga sp. SJP92]|uniref:hypothetical protein n=1 Tax=Flammeovirga sp. SJP92 TaxID=1775430 RepID=UPI0012F763AC|nr:hypothetical protein [Flammeovirga sp. SJP92]